MIQKNKPYVKKYNKGELINPINRHNPYLHKFDSSYTKRKRRIQKSIEDKARKTRNALVVTYNNLLRTGKLAKKWGLIKNKNLSYSEWLRSKF